MEDKSIGLIIGWNRTDEFKLPSRCEAEEWLRQIAQNTRLQNWTKSRCEYVFQSGDLDESLTYNPFRKIYKPDSQF